MPADCHPKPQVRRHGTLAVALTTSTPVCQTPREAPWFRRGQCHPRRMMPREPLRGLLDQCLPAEARAGSIPESSRSFRVDPRIDGGADPDLPNPATDGVGTSD